MESNELQTVPTALMDIDGYNGFENVGQESLTPPFLRIAQPGTSQAMKDDPSYIDGLEPGFFYNTALQKNYGNKLKVVIVGYYRMFVAWKPDNGGFDRSFRPEEYEKEKTTYTKNDRGRDIDADGNEIIDTRNMFLFLPDHPDDGLILFPLSSTGITQSKRWLTKARMLHNPETKTIIPLFASVWEMATVLNQKDQNRWYQIGDKKSTNTKHLGFVGDDQAMIIMGFVKIAKEMIEQATEIHYEAHSNSDEDKIPL